jgi:hypothetical protein
VEDLLDKVKEDVLEHRLLEGARTILYGYEALG